MENYLNLEIKADTTFSVEFREQSDNMTQGQVLLRYNALHLMEFGQVSGVQGLVTINSVNTEHL